VALALFREWHFHVWCLHERGSARVLRYDIDAGSPEQLPGVLAGNEIKGSGGMRKLEKNTALAIALFLVACWITGFAFSFLPYHWIAEWYGLPAGLTAALFCVGAFYVGAKYQFKGD
jgi:hypothetical protein